jgi:hypothetical protein
MNEIVFQSASSSRTLGILSQGTLGFEIESFIRELIERNRT